MGAIQGARGLAFRSGRIDCQHRTAPGHRHRPTANGQRSRASAHGIAYSPEELAPAAAVKARRPAAVAPRALTVSAVAAGWLVMGRLGLPSSQRRARTPERDAGRPNWIQVAGRRSGTGRSRSPSRSGRPSRSRSRPLAHGSPHIGALRVSAYAENMALKLTLIRGPSPALASTECSSQAGNTRSVPSSTRTTTWSVL